MKLKEAFEQFIEECKNGRIKRRSPITILNYRTSMKQLLDWFPIEELSQLTEDLLWQFFNRGEKDKEWKPATIISHRKNLSPFIQWCEKKGYINKNPLKDIPRPRILKKLPDFYTAEEIDNILYTIYKINKVKFARIRNKTILGVLLMIGLRKGELLALKMSDIDLENNVLRVRAETAKNRAPRTVNISYKLKELFEGYFKLREEMGVESYSLWVSANNYKPFTEHGYKHMLQSISQNVGFVVKSHKCRHTFATNGYKATKDIIAVKEALGHEDIKTTMIYAHASGESTKVLVEKNPLNNLF